MIGQLRLFTSYSSTNEDVRYICGLLNQLKSAIYAEEYSDIYDSQEINKHFSNILDYAVSSGNEELANAQFIFREYYLLFVSLSTYFRLLQERKYRLSWDKLQDCFDIAKLIGSFVNYEDRLEVPEIIDLLLQYEALYPRYIYSSSEYIISKSHCSICGKSMQSLECKHLKGHLYWGEMAVEVIDEIKEVQAIAIVSHPEDKRCVMELQDDVSDEIKYEKLNSFLNLNLHRLCKCSIESSIETRKRSDIIEVGRNELCPCGSGLKFKKCCGKNMYYKHERNIVKPGKRIDFIHFPIQD